MTGREYVAHHDADQVELAEHAQRDGQPVERLVPAAAKPKPDVKRVIEELKAFSKGNTLGQGVTIREMIEEGLRF